MTREEKLASCYAASRAIREAIVALNGVPGASKARSALQSALDELNALGSEERSGLHSRPPTLAHVSPEVRASAEKTRAYLRAAAECLPRRAR